MYNEKNVCSPKEKGGLDILNLEKIICEGFDTSVAVDTLERPL
jgi:hypothetical protein